MSTMRPRLRPNRRLTAR